MPFVVHQFGFTHKNEISHNCHRSPNLNFTTLPSLIKYHQVIIESNRIFPQAQGNRNGHCSVQLPSGPDVSFFCFQYHYFFPLASCPILFSVRIKLRLSWMIFDTQFERIIIFNEMSSKLKNHQKNAEICWAVVLFCLLHMSIRFYILFCYFASLFLPIYIFHSSDIFFLGAWGKQLRLLRHRTQSTKNFEHTKFNSLNEKEYRIHTKNTQAPISIQYTWSIGTLICVSSAFSSWNL